MNKHWPMMWGSSFALRPLGLLYFMDYSKIYYDIITKAKHENRKKLSKKDSDYKYYEAHHIIPKCLGGEGKCTQWEYHPNIVLLTAREHYICHALLVEMYPNNNSLASSFLLMCNSPYTKSGQLRYIPPSRFYEIARLAKSRSVITEETRSKMSKAKIGNKNGSGNKGRIQGPPSETTKLKISSANKGRVHTEQSKRNMSLAHLGKSTKRRRAVCPHCKKEGGINGMTRYHFDKCSLKK